MFQSRKSSESFYDGIAFIEPFAGRFAAHKSAATGQPKGPHYDDYK